MMVRVMVVEDSRLILRDITRQVQEFHPKISIKTAGDGESALQLLQSFEPDILFSDIKLPIMDGLTLIRKAKERYPSLKCVIISGYSDFSFAHQALRLHVDEYILKPVEPDTFRQVLANLFHRVEQERRGCLEAFLSGAMRGKTGQTVPEGLPRTYALAVLYNGVIPKYADGLDYADVHASLWNCGESEAWVASARADGEKVVLFDAGRRAQDSVQKRAEGLYKALRRHYPLLNMIYSNSFADYSGLREQYTALSSSLSSLVILGRPGLYSAALSVPNSKRLSDVNAEIALFAGKMQSCVRKNLFHAYEAELRQYTEMWRMQAYPVVFLLRFVLTLITVFFQCADRGDTVTTESPHAVAEKMLAECSDLSGLESKLLECYQHYQSGSPRQGESIQTLAAKIEQYLRQHIYGSITLQDIAGEFQLSPSYISRIMKSHYGESPMDYYNRVKILEARSLLLQPDMRVKDVAALLGFSDQHYFSKAFKRQFGHSPAELKKSGSAN